MHAKGRKGVEMSLDAARKSACATFGFDVLQGFMKPHYTTPDPVAFLAAAQVLFRLEPVLFRGTALASARLP